ncbi:succinate dehydrogenase (ubiquinone) membrane anchor subunit [Sporothrix brasiliensis 5110]|uniref:Succinate dehydrogenase [ubiquinone] cytochrome b small subunit n=1 Tax=Sporothrix brasiliensis 5110 TaxID=1398154 RepID=A0A0C2FE79_9PEZI|nr:succinate dehydrogenase (ubiquinone) membrane anchor subunit [Sporothrix brasiliensis 5110]KIH89448.1 succinate dehydrogenase (ubiquinone) membrane anchor subunit [Sporothrix brasiliensis 5110]
MASIARTSLLRQAATASRMASVRPAFQQQPLFQTTARIAAFHASSRRNLLPPPKQVIIGGVNDAAPIPAPNPSHGSYHWTFERLVAAGIVPLTVAPFAAGSLNPTTDAVLCALLLVHSHLGLQVLVTDYIPEKRFPTARKATSWGLNAITALVGLGLYEFETNDVGVTELVSKLWHA